MYRLAGGVGSLHDVSKDGRLIVHHGFERVGVLARARGDTIEHDLSVFQYSVPMYLSPDGARVLVGDLPSGITQATVPSQHPVRWKEVTVVSGGQRLSWLRLPPR